MTISPDHRRRLVVMLKEPRAGRVKTRLGRDIGMTAAAWWFRHQSRELIRRLRDPRWDIILAISPDKQGMTSRNWPTDLARVPQGTGNLGDRMKRVFDTAPLGPVVIIGADIPGIEKTNIADAFGALGSHDAVFGPSPDGGFWLVGLKRLRSTPRTLFANVRWSSENTLLDTIGTLKYHRIAYVDTLNDVDTVADL